MFPYLKILIKQRIAAWKPSVFISGRKSKVKTIAGMVGIGLSMLMLYAMLVALEYFLFGAFVQLGEPETMLALTGVLCTLLTLFTGFFYILSELFFSKDVTFVSSLPLSSRAILSAKLARIWLGEAGIALLICLPVTVLYGVERSMGVLYYLNALVLIPFMPMVPIAVAALLSFALIRVSALWKRREALTIVVSMLFLAVFMWGEMQVSMSAQDDMSAAVYQLVLKQRQLLDMVANTYPPIRWFADALSQSGLAALGGWLAFAGVNLAAVVAVTLLFGGGYQGLAIRQNETLTRLNATGKRHVDRHGARTPFRAMFRRELREIFIVPVYAMNCLTSAVMFPVLAAVMYFGTGSNGGDLAEMHAALSLVPGPLMAACLTALFAFTTSIDMAVSTSVSREGKRHEFYRTLPVKPGTQLTAKLLMGVTLNLISALPIGILLFFILPAFGTEIVVGFLCGLLFSTGATIASLMLDVSHPKFGWKNETEAIKQNGLAALSMFGSMAFIAACGAAFYGLTVLGVSYVLSFVILCAVAAAGDVLLLKRLRGKTAQTYILQEVRI